MFSQLLQKFDVKYTLTSNAMQKLYFLSFDLWMAATEPQCCDFFYVCFHFVNMEK